MNDTVTPDASASLAGATLGGKYKLQRLLGEGGMGQVYEATNTNTRRRVAIKTLHSHLVANASVRQRFLQEARAATQIEHPNVIDVLDLDIDAELGIPYIVQEFLSGKNLADHLDTAPSRQLAPVDALRIAVPVMGALVAAHALGIVHRDLKPENIFLTRDRAGAEIPKVIDFGIAKVVAGSEALSSTQYGMMLGTPAYMSPEQAMGKTDLIDAQTDVWAVGVVLYQMLSGRLPYEAENPNLTLGMIQYREPTPLAERAPTLDADLLAAIDRALTKDRTLRFATMQSFLGALLETSVWNGVSPSLHPSPSQPAAQPPLSLPRVSQPSVTPPSAPAAASATEPPAASALPAVTATAAVEVSAPVSAGVARPATIQDGWSSDAAVHKPRRAPWVGLVAIALAVLSAVAGVALSQRVGPETSAPVRSSVMPTVVRPSPASAPLAPTPVTAPPVVDAPTPPLAVIDPPALVEPPAVVAQPAVVDPPALAAPVAPIVAPRAPTVAVARPAPRSPVVPRVRPAPTHATPHAALDPDREWHP